jgi:hypothetical protein
MSPTLFLRLLGNAVGVGEAQRPPPQLSATAQVYVGTNNNNDNDGGQPATNGIDNEKQAFNATQTETGVVGIQASQAIWGKQGRWLIIAG